MRVVCPVRVHGASAVPVRTGHTSHNREQSRDVVTGMFLVRCTVVHRLPQVLRYKAVVLTSLISVDLDARRDTDT